MRSLLAVTSSISTSTLIGFGLAGLVIATQAGTEGALRYPIFVGFALLLALIFLSLSAFISVLCQRKTKAFGIALFVWFFFVLLYDGAMLSLAGWITGSLGGRVLFGSVFGNPADLIRVVTLSVAGTPNVLGAAGDAWVRFLGGSTAATLAAIAALTAWVAVPLAAGIQLIRARDL